MVTLDITFKKCTYFSGHYWLVGTCVYHIRSTYTL